MLGLLTDHVEAVRSRLRRHDHTDVPGAIRISFGLQNTPDEVDLLVSALAHIAGGSFRTAYHQVQLTGDFEPDYWTGDAEQSAKN